MKTLLTHKIWFLVGLSLLLLGGILLFFELISLYFSLILGPIGVFLMAASKFKMWD